MKIIQPKGFPALPDDWKVTPEEYTGADGKTRIFSRVFQKKSGPVRRALVISHGIGEYGDRYAHAPHYLKDAVDLIFCPDHRGHGLSEGSRGHVEDFHFFADDLAVGVKHLEEKLKKTGDPFEIHLFGHSMGSLIALDTAFRYPDLPIKSLIISSPLVGIRAHVPFIKKHSAGILSKLWGSLQLSTGLHVEDLSHDPEVIKTYQEDRLVHDRITPRLYIGMTAAMREVSRKDSGIAVPVLAIIPLEDQLTDPNASVAFFQRLKNPGKVLKTYPGFFHESFNETEKEKPFADLKAWLLGKK